MYYIKTFTFTRNFKLTYEPICFTILHKYSSGIFLFLPHYFQTQFSHSYTHVRARVRTHTHTHTHTNILRYIHFHFIQRQRTGIMHITGILCRIFTLIIIFCKISKAYL
uniref:Uncharacterized protein n=1 Tax=Anguilla anguilla TaxID=7936 RepID=A0A0E9X0U3_ANGAN